MSTWAAYVEIKLHIAGGGAFRCLLQAHQFAGYIERTAELAKAMLQAAGAHWHTKQ